MEEPLTISRETPELKSMDYALLREEGLKYIQKIAGKIWTDYNTHDPGITILEVLSYAITDLGYRTAYPMQDLLTPPEGNSAEDIRNFFTAGEILPNRALTANDYRKLMIDVEVHDAADTDCPYAGVKNAWIEKAQKPEVDVFVDNVHSVLTYDPVTPGQSPLELRQLYKVLLEFDECDTYGDLNDNKIIRDLTILQHPLDTDLEGLIIRIDVQFPRWDNAGLDWEDDTAIQLAIIDIEISFLNLSDDFTITPSINSANEVVLSGTKTSAGGPVPIDGLNDIALKINKFIYQDTGNMLALYKKKIAKVSQVVDAVKRTLNENRNLCEDFIEFNALRIEEILVCADIEISLDADVDETQAHIYYEIARFLSATVYFYSLEEMFTDCYDQYKYDVTAVDIDKKTFTINTTLASPPEEDSVITISGSNNNDGSYTVDKTRLNRNNDSYTDITVKETIPSDILTEGEKLIIGNVESEKCRPTEKVFEGPKLKHGFIKDEELEKADRKKVIHVSDLIQIIMDVDGVLAVKNIQIANLPQDNEDGSITSRSVKWCLHLAFDENYVPRLNIEDSRITFYKDQLPFKARQLEVEEIITQLESAERPQRKYRYPFMDIEPPHGEYKNPGDYYSIQNEFPLVYGIGAEGLPPATENKPNEAQARQLKGYLMFFDQLLANYLSQLAHVRDLFSMNPDKDDFGDFAIGRTYYTQPLFDIAPNAADLYVDQGGHADALNDLAEDETLFGVRRNKFLDHLMARFSEQFTDYAMLSYRLSGPKGDTELIEDKLAFLNAYPTISADRGKAINYKKPCHLWHIDNVSGLESRASMLLGIETRKPSTLQFSPAFKIAGTEPNLTFTIENSTPAAVLESTTIYKTLDAAKEALELVIMNGVSREKFQPRSTDGTNYYFGLVCDGAVLAQSVKKNFPSPDTQPDVGLAIDEAVAILSTEFFENSEANRRNLSCSIGHYVSYTVVVDMAANPPSYTINYSFFKNAYSTNAADKILSGTYTGTGDAKVEVAISAINTATKTFTVEGNIIEHLAAGDRVIIDSSAGADGTYTVTSFALNGANTNIVVNEAIGSGAAPLGVLLYDQMTQIQMETLAESKVHDVLWNVVSNGVRRERYEFHPHAAPFTPSYKFRIKDFIGNVLAQSEASDFNTGLALEILNTTSGKVKVEGSTANDREYNVVAAVASGPSIEVRVTPAPSSPIGDGNLSFTETFPVKAIDQTKGIFTVAGNLSVKLPAGSVASISGSTSNDDTYTVMSVTFNGTDSFIKVEENIPSATPAIKGSLSYTKSFGITSITADKFIVTGGADETAVQKMIDFLKLKFFSHEGMHLIEHILLRPKTNGLLLTPADETTLSETLAVNGSLQFTKKHPLASAVSSTRTFRVAGNHTADLAAGMQLHITDAILLAGDYTVASRAFDGTNTNIVVSEAVARDINPASAEGTLSYSFTANIVSIDAVDQKIVISGNVEDTVATGDLIEITGSQAGTNDGTYSILIAADVGANTEITIDDVEALVQDRLLTINLNDDCDCAVEDPYTCIAHMVLPCWPGRFLNNDFRKFVEKTLRTEAPAHVFLNICWVSCAHMDEFELRYKAWLIENARPEADQAALSKTLGELIGSLEQLRNVYPVGRLHDCEEDETLENAIILNQSALGEL